MELATLDKVVRGSLVDALRKTGGDVWKAAELLGISRATAYRYISRYGIERSEWESWGE